MGVSKGWKKGRREFPGIGNFAHEFLTLEHSPCRGRGGRKARMKKLLAVLLLSVAPHFVFGDDFPPFSTSLPVGTNCVINMDVLHPLQCEVGMHEIELRAAKIRKKSPEKLEKYLLESGHIVPVVIGPGGTVYVTDHHHLCRALIESGVRTSVYATVKGNYADFTPEKFWRIMKVMNWVYERDENGREIKVPDDLPKTIKDLRDDPFRSLAWMVRHNDGYFYTDEELPDFQWANFFRTRVKIGEGPDRWDRALADAMKICHSDEAKNLPGYTKEQPKADAKNKDAD